MADWTLELALSPVEVRDQAVRIKWDPQRLRRLADAEPEYGGPPPWTDISWGGTGLLRTIGAAFEDGTLLVVAGLRSDGASGHDEEAVRGLLARTGEEAANLAEVLLSTEYGPDGAVRRLGLELYEDAEAAPIRVAGDREGPVTEEFSADGNRMLMAFRMAGIQGTGLYELVRQV